MKRAGEEVSLFGTVFAGVPRHDQGNDGTMVKVGYDFGYRSSP